jgi:hypothetical protein
MASMEQTGDFVACNTAADLIAEGAEKRVKQQLRRFKERQLTYRHSAGRRSRGNDDQAPE